MVQLFSVHSIITIDTVLQKPSSDSYQHVKHNQNGVFGCPLNTEYVDTVESTDKKALIGIYTDDVD